MKKVIVLGASGSIGRNALDIIRKFPASFQPVGFSVHTNLAFAQVLQKEFPNARCFITTQHSIEAELLQFIKDCHADIAVNGIAGAMGLYASVACIKAGVDLALANKESIVMAGELLQSLAEKMHTKIIPVDSEHSAVFYLMRAFGKDAVKKIILTASGGPFRTATKEELERVRVSDALKHPTWDMGGKISIDSATLANKALEVIEATVLFGIKPEDITVSVHPESIVHSMIQLKNGEVYAQMSPPDMRYPILAALTFPHLSPPYIDCLDFSKYLTLHFEPPRFSDFPLLPLGFQAAAAGMGYRIAFNAANEAAVADFLSGKLRFLQIAETVDSVLQLDWHVSVHDYETVFAVDKKAREVAAEAIGKGK